MRNLFLAAVATAGLVGCVGQLDTGSGGGGGGVGSGTNPPPAGGSGMARMMFETDVYPIIHDGIGGAAAQCSGCHTAGSPQGNVTGFVAPALADAYGTITSYQSVVGNFASSAAGILTHVALGHQSRMYTTDQLAKITAWLNQEVVERGAGSGSGSGSGESPGQATARLLNNWSACMTQANFTTAGMATAWGQMQANNGSRCESCHATGGQGFIATEVDTTFFTVLSTNQYYMVPYFSVDLTVTPATVIINHTAFDGVSKGQPPHTEHPQFNSTTNGGMTALQKFYDLTAASVAAGGCGPTKLSPPMM